MMQWYETLFANFGKTYDRECFTQGTVGEVDFVERELGGDRSKQILDIACGTGRHAIELAKRGYCVTGFAKVDIFGCHIGQFSREHVLTADDFEMLVVAEKDDRHTT